MRYKECVLPYDATLVLIGRPARPGFTLAHDKVVRNASGKVGALLRRDKEPRMYWLYGCGVMYSIDQHFAASIAKL